MWNSINLDSYQKAVLHFLLDKYERSKTYRGENKVKQTFSCESSAIFPDYYSDFASVEKIQEFHESMDILEKMGLIVLKWKQAEIDTIYALEEKWEEYYAILHRESKSEVETRIQKLYRRYLGSHEIIDKICEEQINRIQEGKKSKYKEGEIREILDCLDYILHNDVEILERELSIAVFGDSKKFKGKYRNKICKILKESGCYEDYLKDIDDEKEIFNTVLEENNIVSNPSYVYFKGEATIYFLDRSIMKLEPTKQLAFSSVTLEKVERIIVENKIIMTVENLTSYNRMSQNNVFYIFLSGYHNSSKQRLLVKLYENNPNKCWKHFGDIDPDGFYIVKNMIENTGIPFQTQYMNIEMLDKYKAYSKKLNENDRTKAKSLIGIGYEKEVISYMLEKDCKLEQEIVSWLEEGKVKK